MLLNKAKLAKTSLLLFPFLVIAVFLIYQPKNTKTVIPTVQTQEVFKATDKLTFLIDLQDKPKINFISSIVGNVFAQSINTYTEDDLIIKPTIINTNTNSVYETDLGIEKVEENKFLVSVEKQDASLVPGKYELVVDITQNGSTFSLKQDFAWGVLAINPNKSIYTPGQTATIGMAVLDEKGEMVCDADVTLEITSPNGLITNFKTSDYSININPNCSKKEYIPSPDFEAKYVVSTTGTYNMKLTAVTPNGAYAINDFFEVREHVPFDVERITATRIYPPINYPVKVIIKAHENFVGTIEEYVPASFGIVSDSYTEITKEKNPDYDSSYQGVQFVQSAQYIQTEKKADVNTIGNLKKISWSVSLKKGMEYQLEYAYKAPDISPEFYLLGPLTFSDTHGKVFFQELRKWQIAADAVAHVQSNASNSQNTSSASATLTTTSGNYLIFFCGTSESRTITGPGGSWTEVYNEGGNTPSWTTYRKAAAGGSETPACSWTSSTTAGAILLEYSGVDSVTPFNTSNTANGTGDASVECPAVNPGVSTYGYISGLIYKGDVTVSTWSNSFNERQDLNTGTGASGLRINVAAADKSASGSQSTTATMSAGTGAWRCHTVALNQSTGDSLVGRVYTDDNESTAITSTSICATANGGTPSCATTDGSGIFTITLETANTDELIFFIDGGTYAGNTVTIADGGNIVTGDALRIYQNHVLTRYETGSNLTIVNMDSYDNDQNATDMLYDAEDASPDTLSWETGVELFIPAGFTFAPGGNLDGHDIEIDGVYTSAASQTINLDGSFKQDVGGTFTPSTSAITFDGTAGTEVVTTDGTGNLYNMTVNDGGGSLTLQVQDPLIVNNLTITGGTLDVVSGENNQITLFGNWDNDDTFTARSGTILMDGSSATTYTMDADGTGTDAFYNLTFNDQNGGATFQLTGALDVDNDITITGGTLDSNANSINVGRNWTNDDIFTEGTATVTFDGREAATLDSGCSAAASCTNENFYNLTINKLSGAKTVTLSATDLRVTNTLTITDGILVQGALNVQVEGGSAVNIAERGVWRNISTGDLTLAGTFLNNGLALFNSNGMACGDSDSILLRSTAAAQRSWNGNGAFVLTDVNVEYQSGSATIRTASSTNTGNNGSNWAFVNCNEMYIEGVSLEGLSIN